MPAEQRWPARGAELRALLIAEGYRLAPFTGNLVAIHGSHSSHEQLLAWAPLADARRPCGTARRPALAKRAA